MSKAVLSQLAALQTMKTSELVAKWRELNDSDPPPYNKTFLISRLSYRVQELAYGGLKPETIKQLEALGKNLDGGSVTRRKVRADRRPVSGTQLQRDWKGQTHIVTVRTTDFEWEGRPYKHLTSIARAITGTNWNGWVFFGLKKPGSGS
ncbi:MAG: DUF2924 domain-containing protein [Pseudomonadota bacterium]